MGDLAFGLMVAGIGMGAIFGILGILILFITGFSYLLNYRKNNKKTVEVPVGCDNGISPKTVAAITACINCFYETEESHVEFIVKSIKRNKR